MNDNYSRDSIWQDGSSLGEDGLVDFYIMKDKWEFLYRNEPWLSIIDHDPKKFRRSLHISSDTHPTPPISSCSVFP